MNKIHKIEVIYADRYRDEYDLRNVSLKIDGVPIKGTLKLNKREDKTKFKDGNRQQYILALDNKLLKKEPDYKSIRLQILREINKNITELDTQAFR